MELTLKCDLKFAPFGSGLLGTSILKYCECAPTTVAVKSWAEIFSLKCMYINDIFKGCWCYECSFFQSREAFGCSIKVHMLYWVYSI